MNGAASFQGDTENPLPEQHHQQQQQLQHQQQHQHQQQQQEQQQQQLNPSPTLPPSPPPPLTPPHHDLERHQCHVHPQSRLEFHARHREPNIAEMGGVGTMATTPDEVLTLGVLTLAGLWPGTWCGIAAIIMGKVEQLSQRGAAELPFQRCARSLVDMLLRSPGEANLALETWQELDNAKARLPDDLGQVLGVACSLLQRQSMAAADIRVRKKRRRALSTDAVDALSVTAPHLAPLHGAAMVVLISDIEREAEEMEGKKRKIEREREKKKELLLHSPALELPPSSRPQPSCSLSPPLPPPSPPIPPYSEAPSLPSQETSPGTPPPPIQQPSPPQMQASYPSILSVLPLRYPVVGDQWESAAGDGGVGGGAGSRPVPEPRSALPPQRPVADSNSNGGYHQGMDEVYPFPPMPPPLPHGAEHASQSSVAGDQR